MNLHPAFFALPLAFAATLPGLPLHGAESAENDWLLIPGRRAGPITGEWTGADLQQAFGTEHCRKTEIPVGEGETVSGYLIYPDTADELQVFLDAESGKVASVVIQRPLPYPRPEQPETPPPSRWHSKSGITLGSTVQEVEVVNGGSFVIGEFETDYPGHVTSWNEGKIPDTFTLRFVPTDWDAYDAFSQRVGSEGIVFDGTSGSTTIASFKPVVYYLRIEL